MKEAPFFRRLPPLRRLLWMHQVTGGSSSILKTVTGTLLHITDALAKPAKKFTATLEPTQDLHGQDAPYPAGGGKNKLDPSQMVSGGINASGGDAENPTRVSSGFIPVTTGEVWTASIESGKKIVAFHGYTSSKGNATANVTGITSYTIPSGVAYIRVMFGFNDDSNISLSDISSAQVEKGSSATAYAPYSNECPITGHTGANVVRTGKNLFDSNAVTDNSYLSTTTGLPEAQAGYVVSDYIPVIKNQGVIIPASGTARRWFYDKNKNPITYLNNSGNQLFTPSDDGYIRISISKTSQFYSTYIVAYGDYAPSSGLPTDYEPYTATTIPITFPDAAGTVYGCTLTNEGANEWKLRVDMGIQNLGVLTWTAHPTYGFYSGGLKTIIKSPSGNSFPFNALCSNYKIVSQANESTTNYSIACDTTGIIYINDNNYSDAATFKAALNGVQLVYELATPIEYTLAETQALTLLKDTNNIWTDIPESELELTYYAKAEETP